VDIVLYPAYELSKTFFCGPLLEYHSRIENPNKQPYKKRYYQDERSAAFGAQINYDTRDSILDPHEGINLDINMKLMPSILSSLDSQKTFGEANIDFRNYHSMSLGCCLCLVLIC
jgi:outer membrane protein assembly factor BamA